MTVLEKPIKVANLFSLVFLFSKHQDLVLNDTMFKYEIKDLFRFKSIFCRRQD